MRCSLANHDDLGDDRHARRAQASARASRSRAPRGSTTTTAASVITPISRRRIDTTTDRWRSSGSSPHRLRRPRARAARAPARSRRSAAARRRTPPRPAAARTASTAPSSGSKPDSTASTPATIAWPTATACAARTSTQNARDWRTCHQATAPTRAARPLTTAVAQRRRAQRRSRQVPGGTKYQAVTNGATTCGRMLQSYLPALVFVFLGVAIGSVFAFARQRCSGRAARIAREARAVRVRPAVGRPAGLPLRDQLLPDRDAVHPVRHRGHLPLPDRRAAAGVRDLRARSRSSSSSRC